MGSSTMGFNFNADDGRQIAMKTSRLFIHGTMSRAFFITAGFGNHMADCGNLFCDRFSGDRFFLLKDEAPDQKPQPVAATFKREVREPIKLSAGSNRTAPGAEKPQMQTVATVEQEVPETEEQQAREPSTASAGSSGMQDVLPDDTPGKGMLSQSMDKPETTVPPEDVKASERPSPPSVEKPPTVAENTEPAEEKLQPKDTAPVAAQPPEISPPSENPAVAPPEPETGVKSRSLKENLKEVTVGVVAGNVRKGPSVKEAVLFRIARGDTLQMTRQKGNWYAVRTGDGRSGWAHHTLFKTPSPRPEKANSQEPKSRKKVVIRGIRTVVTDPNRAQIVFELNGYYPPEVMVIEGNVPRVVCDFFSARLAPGIKKSFPVKTGVVKRVRVGVHKGSEPKIRVVLDLESGKNYAVEQFFFEKENYYALMVNSIK
jgi:hypothetical protein